MTIIIKNKNVSSVSLNNNLELTTKNNLHQNVKRINHKLQVCTTVN